MSKVARRVLLLLGALLTVSLAAPNSVLADDWSTKGKTELRQQTAGEWLGAVEMVPAWQRVLGASGSQPILVGKTIYHLAGDALWQITPDGNASQLFVGINKRPSTSGITYAVINGTGVLFFGTGDNWICALRLDLPGSPNCLPLEGSEPIVTVPLVFPPANGRFYDIVVMGDKNGNLWVVKNLANTDTSKTRFRKFGLGGGWVLASPVPIGPEVDLGFVFGVDNGTGTIGARQIIPGAEGDLPQLRPVWPSDAHPDSGVADGFARDGDRAYVSDKGGVFQRVHAVTGDLNPVSYGATFANASPAVDDKTIYFVLREGPDEKTGRIVAVDKANWVKGTAAVKWTRDIPAPANTNPLILVPKDGGSPVVLVGDIKGNLYAFNETDGSDYLFANGQASKLAVADPGQVGQWYQTTTGVIDPILASGSGDQPLLLTGLSGSFDPAPFLGDPANQTLINDMKVCPGTGKRECGVLVAYRTKPLAIDLAAGPPVAPAELPCIPGAQQQITWTVTNNAGGAVTDVPYKVTVAGASGYRRTLRDTRTNLAKGDTQDMEFIYIKCGETYTIEVHVNDPPNDDKRLKETDYSNNHSTATITVAPYDENVGVAATDSGSSKVLIIPADCKIDPSRPPDSPCSNYNR